MGLATKRESKQLYLTHREKQTQGGCQTDETKRYGPNERSEQNPRKRAKQNGDNQLIRYTVQSTGYPDAPGTHWVLQ